MRRLLWWVGVPVSAFLCGTLLGLPLATFASFVLPFGEILGLAAGATLGAWTAWRIGENAVPDGSSGRLAVVLLFALGSLVLGVPVAGVLFGGGADGIFLGPTIYQVPAAMVFAATGAALATWCYRQTAQVR